MIAHFIITRYNLAIHQWYKGNENLFESEQWLIKRNEYFLRFCLPSVINQKNKNFTWLIFFQKGTDSNLKPILLELENFCFIKPVFIDRIGELEHSIYLNISSEIEENVKKIVMTRLDNDDALGNNFTNKIQQSAKLLKQDSIIDIPNGLCLDIYGNYKLTKILFRLNQFISIVRSPENFRAGQSIYSFQHLDASKHFPVTEISSKKLWLQIVHDQNQLNYSRGKLISFLNLKGYPNFGIKFELKNELNVLLIDLKLMIREIPGYYRCKNVLKYFFN